MLVASNCVAVSVFQRGAEVFRHALVTVPVTHDLNTPLECECGELPLSLIDHTLRARVVPQPDHTGAAEVVSCRIGIVTRTVEPIDQTPLEQEFARVKQAIAVVVQDKARIERELSLLLAMPMPSRPPATPHGTPAPSPMAGRVALFEFVDSEGDRRRTELRQLDEQLRTLRLDEARLVRELALQSTASTPSENDVKKSAQLSLLVTHAGTITIELSYHVPGAQFAPAYQVRLKPDGSEARLLLRAHVVQNTGEDWRRVKLRLYTSMPLATTALPELPALRLGRAVSEPRRRGFQPPPLGAAALFADFDRLHARPPAVVVPPLPAGFHDVWSEPQATRGERAERATRTMRATPPVMVSARAPAPAPRAMKGVAANAADDDHDAVRFEDGTSDGLAEPMLDSAPMNFAATGGARPKRLANVDEDNEVLAVRLPHNLVLQGPASAQRGRLIYSDDNERYATSVRRFVAQPPYDVAGLCQKAARRAEGTAQLALPAGCVPVHALETHFAFAYDAERPVDIDSDGVFHVVPLQERVCEAQTRYVTVPREDMRVYRTVVLKNPLPQPLLPGPAELYVGDHYVLTSTLPVVMARAELNVAMGIEDAIKVARNTTFTEQRSGEKVVAMTELVHNIHITVQSSLPRAVPIEVRERVPIAAEDAEVVVEETATPPWESYSQEDRQQVVLGGRVWRLTLEPQTRVELRANYTVKIYANNDLEGGNRREREVNA